MSLKGDKYETAEEIRFRLENSVVLYDDKPVYIKQVSNCEQGDGEEVARVHFIGIPFKSQAKTTRKFLSSKHFDLTPFKMGYMNHHSGGQLHRCLYLTRAPIRQQRQGLTNETLCISDSAGRVDRDYDLANICRFSGFSDMVEGKYPSFGDALKMVGDENILSVAVSRQLAMEFTHDLELATLLHKFTPCGVIRKNEKGVTLPPKFRFLKEELEECNIPCL